MTAGPVRLRPGRLDDLDAIAALDRATELAPHWPVAAYAAILNVTWADPAVLSLGPHPLRCLLVAEQTGAGGAIEDADLVGFAVGLVHPAFAHDPCGAEVEDVVVAAGYRRAGVGRALCSAVVDWCRSQGATEVMLEVRAANAGAVALYEQLGFEKVGRRPGYYRDPDDDAVAMRLRWGISTA